MYMYMTSGTADFMEKVRAQHGNDHIFIMHGEGNTLLLQESESKKSAFSVPRKYEVLDAVGELQQKGYFVLNNIPVADEGRPVFEHRFSNRANAIENEPGFIAFRLLRPLDSDTYVVLTQWGGPASFEAWQNSQAFQKAHSERPVASPTQNIFSGKSYVTKYSAPVDEA